MSNLSDKPESNAYSVAASEARLRALVTASSDIIYSMSPDWRVMQQLDGRGFLSDTDQPLSDWQSIYVPVREQKKVQKAIDEAIAEKKIF